MYAYCLLYHPLHTHTHTTTTQILTQEEFRTIRQKQLSSKLAPRRGVKRQLTELLAQQEERREGEGELLPEAAIMTLDHVKMKYDKKARLESIKVHVHVHVTVCR